MMFNQYKPQIKTNDMKKKISSYSSKPLKEHEILTNLFHSETNSPFRCQNVNEHFKKKEKENKDTSLMHDLNFSTYH